MKADVAKFYDEAVSSDPGARLGARALLAGPAAAETFDLPATPATVAWGNYDAAHAPALRSSRATRW
jgi:hypothetical protein